MRGALNAYLWWVLGIATAVALAWAYNRRLMQALLPDQFASPDQSEPPPSETPPVAGARPRPSGGGGSSELADTEE